MIRAAVLLFALAACAPRPRAAEALARAPAARGEALAACREAVRNGPVCDAAARGDVQAQGQARQNAFRKGFR